MISYHSKGPGQLLAARLADLGLRPRHRAQPEPELDDHAEACQ